MSGGSDVMTAPAMEYCPPNVTLSEFWVNHGVSLCLMETIFSSLQVGWMILLGSVQYLYFRKHGSPRDLSLRPPSKLYSFQLFLHVLFPLLSVAQIFIVLAEGGLIYGYMVLSLASTAVAWPLALLLLTQERRSILPTIPTPGHGLVLLVFWTITLVKENLAFINIKNVHWWFILKSHMDEAAMAIFVIRYGAALCIFFLGLKAPGIANTPPGARLLEDRQNRSTFANLWRKLRTLFPYLWPKNSLSLQLVVLFCFVLLVAGRIGNLFTPILYKLVVDSMTFQEKSEPTKNGLQFRWDLILAYVGVKFFQGGVGGIGLINNMRALAWIKIQQYTAREVQLELFAHLHSLSLRWHLSRKTGEVLRVMDRGTNSITTLLSYILFNIVPTIADIIIAVIYFTSSFNAWFGLIVFVTMITYLAATIWVTEWRTKYRRSMNLADNEAKAKATDSILNFETVKYFSGEEFEVSRYRSAILKFQVEEWKSIASLTILNTLQNLVINVGLLVGSLFCAYLVVDKGQLTVGDYVLFSTYMIQLYQPLNWFGTYYRMIQQSFIDMENMFDLLSEEVEVKDVPLALSYYSLGGAVEFRDVHFRYHPDKPVLEGISFQVKPGRTLALVGPSGEGKSTVVRLLFRFYDVDAGVITIDNQEVKKVQQRSLRKEIGVVPQDTMLFNDTIMYNIRYAYPEASDADVIAAAKAADIHDRIMTFPDQYETQVGERGLKLSGGEKQRVAIARMILKAPSLVLLDEATSSLDTESERKIQSALAALCKNRTSLIVAHRLSTIIHADEILVLKDGRIAESGRHEDLLNAGGIYAALWSQQQKKNDSNDSSEGVVVEDPPPTSEVDPKN